MGKSKGKLLTISAPNLKTAVFIIKGTAPYVQLKFSEKVKNQLLDKMGTEGKASKTKRTARNYKNEFEDAMYLSDKGWRGIPAAAFRNAMISACRLADFKMTLAKLSVKVVADGYDKNDGTPLVKIEGKPEISQLPVRNATGVVDIRTRAMWRSWKAKVCVEFDADQFTQTDIANLLMRVGLQVGIGEGRQDSKRSNGMGWGFFTI